jgi:hypothetical protein
LVDNCKRFRSDRCLEQGRQTSCRYITI